MEPSKDRDAIVDLVDVLLRDGAVLRADVIVTVADVPLVGIKLTAAIAGMETMTAYGLFEEWDASRREQAVERRQYGRPEPEPETVRLGSADADDDRPSGEDADREAGRDREAEPAREGEDDR